MPNHDIADLFHSSLYFCSGSTPSQSCHSRSPPFGHFHHLFRHLPSPVLPTKSSFDTFAGLFTVKTVLLYLVSILLPLVTPRIHIPIDPVNPDPPSPEQTASLLSFLTYTFVERLVWLAYRTPKLQYSTLPPLADYDRAEYLRSWTLYILSPFTAAPISLDTTLEESRGKQQIKEKRNLRRYLLWTLLRTFWGTQAMVVLMQVLRVCAGFASPYAIKQLLAYLEARPTISFLSSSGLGLLEESAPLLPRTSILLLFLGPLISSMAWERHIYTQTHFIVRVEAVLTQLVFEHALSAHPDES